MPEKLWLQKVQSYNSNVSICSNKLFRAPSWSSDKSPESNEIWLQ